MRRRFEPPEEVSGARTTLRNNRRWLSGAISTLAMASPALGETIQGLRRLPPGAESRRKR